MTLAATYLVVWDYDRLKPILFHKRSEKAVFLKYEFIWLPILFAFGGIFAASFGWLIRLGNAPDYFNIGVVLSIAGLIFGIFVTLHHRFMKVGALEKSGEIS